MRAFIVAFLIGAIVTLAAIVINGAQSQDCEQQYNEWSATVDMAKRDALFQHGLDTGCFHYN